MKRTIGTLWFVICLLPGSAFAGELEERVELKTYISTLFQAEEFDELDRLAEKYRTQESRTESGLWKLTLFYDGLYVPQESDGEVEALFVADEEKFRRWAEQNPNSAVAHIGYAQVLINHAWFFRGSGWASEVPREAWKPFREYHAKAHRHLLDHRQDALVDPQWYNVMLRIAKAENWPRSAFQKLVDEAVGRHPYFYEIYFKAIDYLLPMWHGDPAQIEEFANFAVEKTQDKEGLGMYARIYWYASQAQFRTELFTDTQIVWDKMSVGIDDVLARYPDQWNINNFAHFACLARDRRKTAELTVRIEDGPILYAWQNKRESYEKCRKWATN
jgi:hypothetical protein